jgi:L-malate glycosyltransferase
MNRIKILYVVDTIDDITAGSERQISQLIKYLDREKYEPYLVALRNSKWLDSGYFPCDKHALGLNSVLSLNGYQKMRKLRDFISQRGFHIVQTFFPDSNVVGVLAAHQAGCKLIISTRRNTGFFYNTKTLLATQFANRHVNVILANSELAVEALSKKERIVSSRFSVIYNGLDPSRFEIDDGQIAEAGKRMDLQNKNKVVGIVANFRPVKDIECFIEACAIVRDEIDDARFIIIGNGNEQMTSVLKNLSKSRGLRDKISFMGKIEIPIPYIKNFDVGVLSSKSEGLSNTLMEYGAVGSPSVATRVGGNPEVIQHNKTGILVPVSRPCKMAEEIIKLLKDNELRIKMGQTAYKTVWSKFNLLLSIKLHQALYTKLFDQI